MARNEKGYNLEKQTYKDITIQLINRVYKKGLDEMKAKRFLIIPPGYAIAPQTNQNVWIPNKHLSPDGTLLENQDLDYVFRKAQMQLTYAGYTEPIIGIKRRSQVSSSR